MPTQRGFMTLDELRSHEASETKERLQEANETLLRLQRSLQPTISAISGTVTAILEEYCGAVFPYAATKTEVRFERYGEEWKYVWRVWVSNLTTVVIRLSDGPALEVFCPSRFCWQLDRLRAVLQEQTGIPTTAYSQPESEGRVREVSGV